MLRYIILILSILMIGCTTYAEHEKEALRKTRVEAGCRGKVSVALSVSLEKDWSYIIKTKGCGKYYTYYCVPDGGCAVGDPKCQRIHIESEPTKDAGDL